MTATLAPARRAARPAADPARSLRDRLSKAATADEAAAAAIAWLSASRDVLAAARVRQSASGEWDVPAHTFEGPAFETADWRAAAEHAAAAAVATGGSAEAPLGGVRNAGLFAVPTAGGTLVAASLVDRRAAAEARLLAADAAVRAWSAEDARRAGEADLRVTAAALELTARVRDADTHEDADRELVSAVAAHLGADVVALARSRGPLARVACVSGRAKVDRRSAATRRLEDAMNEGMLRGRLSVAPAADLENRDSLLAHRRLRSDRGAAAVLTHPLLTSAGEAVGVWTAVFDDTPPPQSAGAFLAAASTPAADALAARRRKRRRGPKRPGVLLTAAAVLAAAAAGLSVPVPYAVTCDCRTEPTVRRFVVAPHDGLLATTAVRPGDAVAAGQTVATLDAADTRLELAGLIAADSQAAKDADAALVAGDAAAAQLANLERERVAARRGLLERRLEAATVRSPVDGVVLDGELDRAENAPVRAGDPLFEIAPAGGLLVEVALPAEDVPHFRAGDAVSVRLDGLESALPASVESVRPQSEVRGGRNVFVLEARLEDPDGTLRPGMEGAARVTGRPSALGWNLFHKPWQRLRASLPFGWSAD